MSKSQNSLGTMLTLCPLNNNVGYADACPARQCQYNGNGTCNHKEMTATDPETYLESNNLLERADKARKRIKAYTYVDQYVMYALNKSLMQVSKEELQSLIDEKRFYAWPRAKKNTYWVIEAVFTEMFVPRKVNKTGMLPFSTLNKTFRKQVEAVLTIRL